DYRLSGGVRVCRVPLPVGRSIFRSGLGRRASVQTISRPSGTAEQREFGRRRSAGAIGFSNAAFYTCLGVIGGTYVLLIVAMLAADASYMVDQTLKSAAASEHPWQAVLTHNPIMRALADPRIQYSIWLS